MKVFSAAQMAILQGDPGAGFYAQFMQLDHPDGASRMSTLARNWTDPEGREWLGGAGILSVTGLGSGVGGMSGIRIEWPGAPVGLVTLARDGRVAGCTLTMWQVFFSAAHVRLGEMVQQFRGVCEQPEITADPERPVIALTVESRFLTLSRARPLRMTPADQGRWFGAGAGRDTGFDFVAALQSADPFGDD